MVLHPPAEASSAILGAHNILFRTTQVQQTQSRRRLGRLHALPLQSHATVLDSVPLAQVPNANSTMSYPICSLNGWCRDCLKGTMTQLRRIMGDKVHENISLCAICLFENYNATTLSAWVDMNKAAGLSGRSMRGRGLSY